MKFNLKNKVAIITGGGSGIGRAISITLASQGADVQILDYNLNAAIETITEIHSNGNKGDVHQCDVSKKESVHEIINSIGNKVGVDILINNAGIAHVGNIEKVEEDDLDLLYNVNVKGVFNCTKAAMPFLKNNEGVILNLASIGSSVGLNDRFAYSMSKGAVLTMTYSVAKDYIKHGIRCNCISPGRVHTPFVDGFIKKNYPGKEKEMFEKLSKTQPIGRMGTTQEIADLVLFLCSDEAGFITGSNFPIDGGFVTLNGN